MTDEGTVGVEYVGPGVAFEAAPGVVPGRLPFDDLAVGIGVGIGIGLTTGASPMAAAQAAGGQDDEEG